MLNKWLDLMSRFGLERNESELDGILTMHSESHRAYHNMDHVRDCLSKLDSLVELNVKDDIEMAFWYHDIIYNPYGKNNELKSAIRAKEFLLNQRVEQQRVDNICNLIIATMHTQVPENVEQEFIMDIDISILGSTAIEYESYTKSIRKEYKFVPWFLYRKSRLRIMESFLKRENLYFSEYYRSKYESNARRNIAREIDQLKS